MYLANPDQGAALGLGEGPTRRLELVDYGVESRPLTQNRARSLDLDLDSTETRTRQIHFWELLSENRPRKSISQNDRSGT